ncbi:S8 family serine peptidase [bacterium]|nr:S8 family serine peptidase [bacterium]
MHLDPSDPRHERWTQGDWMGHKRTYRTGVLIVDYIPHEETPGGVSDTIEDIMGAIEDLAQRLVPGGATVRERSRNRYRYWFSAQVEAVDDQAEADIPALAVELMRVRSDVWNAQPSFQLLANAVTDDYYKCKEKVPEQWGMDAVRAQDVHKYETGQPNVLITILDSGIVMNTDHVIEHDDLIRDRFEDGIDFTDEAGEPVDISGHGTLMAGVIAADSQNDEGIDGLNQVSPVYACRIFKGGVLHTETLSHALSETYAAAFGSYVNDSDVYEGPVIPGIDRVVCNLSLSDIDYELANEHLKGFFQELHDNPEHWRIVYCCAMGNDSNDVPQYPAAYASLFPEIILAVGGTMLDPDDPKREIFEREWSCWGEHLTVLAPGYDIWSTRWEKYIHNSDDYCYELASMTSIATAMASGVASLLWSRCTALDSSRIVEILCRTAELLPELRGDAVWEPLQWGHGRINAYLAVPDVKLTSDVVVLPTAAPGETVQMALPLEIKSCIDLHLWVEGPGLDASPFRAGEGQFEENGVYDAYQPFDGLVVGYEGTTFDGDDSEPVKLRCTEFGDKWSLPFTLAGGTRTANAHLALVLDKSGSMSQASGVPGKTRMDVQRLSAGVVVDYMIAGDRISLAAFSDDAEALTSQEIGDTPTAAAAARQALLDDINDLSPGGRTSIGDGVVKGDDALEAQSGYSHEAILVLTDGIENTKEYIEDISPAHKVYAIGLGDAHNVDEYKLRMLTGDDADCYTLISGDLDAANEFTVAKFLLQIVTDLAGGQVLVDPTDRIRPGETPSIPFNVTAADRRLEVCVLATAREVVSLSLVAPDGTELDPGHPTYHAGDNISYYRLPLPLVLPGSGLTDERAHVGEWQARLRVDEAKLTDHMSDLSPENPAHADFEQNGIPYTVLVNVESNLSLRCSQSQEGHAPGAEMSMEARLTLGGEPVDRDAEVEVRINLPGGGETVEKMKQIAPGRYAASPRMEVPGVYRCLFTATGEIHGGQPFMREQVRTGCVKATRPLSPLLRAVHPVR